LSSSSYATGNNYSKRVINHSEDVLQEIYDMWDYFDEKRDAMERLERYLRTLLNS